RLESTACANSESDGISPSRTSLSASARNSRSDSSTNGFARRMATSDLINCWKLFALSGHMEPLDLVRPPWRCRFRKHPSVGLERGLAAQVCIVTTTSILPPASTLLFVLQLPIRLLRDLRERQHSREVVAVLERDESISHLERLSLHRTSNFFDAANITIHRRYSGSPSIVTRMKSANDIRGISRPSFADSSTCLFVINRSTFSNWAKVKYTLVATVSLVFPFLASNSSNALVYFLDFICPSTRM